MKASHYKVHSLKEVEASVRMIRMTKTLAKKIIREGSIPGMLPGKGGHSIGICSAVMAMKIHKLAREIATK